MQILENIILWIFLRSGSLLFKTVVLYPSNADLIEVVHFGISEQAIAKSCHEFSENSIK
jgi:hypothetical protein